MWAPFPAVIETQKITTPTHNILQPEILQFVHLDRIKKIYIITEFSKLKIVSFSIVINPFNTLKMPVKTIKKSSLSLHRAS
jgi:hypothetical protein